MNDPRAGDAGERCLVDADRRCTGDRRAHHARMQHAGQTDITGKILLAEHFFREIDATRRLADDLVILVALQWRIGGDVVRVSPQAIPAHIRAEGFATDDLPVGNLPRRIAARRDDAVLGLQFGDRHRQRPGRFRQQDLARLCGRLHQRRAAPRDALRATRPAHVHRASRVAQNHADRRQRHIELFGDHLRDRDFEPLAAVDGTVEDIDLAVLVDRQIGVETVGEQGGIVGRVRRWFCRLRPGVGRGDADDEGPGCGEKRTAVELKMVHHVAPQACFAARRTALTAALCVPHRQTRSANAARASVSVGLGLRASRAAPSIIQPLMQ